MVVGGEGESGKGEEAGVLAVGDERDGESM